MTANAFGDTQRQLLRILAHHMIHIAERAHVLDSQRANGHVLENASRLWSGKAVFEWKAVQIDGPRELDQDLDLFACCSALHDKQEVTSTGFNGELSTLNFGDIPASWNSVLETVSPDNHSQRAISRTTCATNRAMFDQCLRCHHVHHAASLQHVVCDDGNLNVFSDSLPGFTFPEIQPSAAVGSTPDLENVWNWWDPPAFSAEFGTSQIPPRMSDDFGVACSTFRRRRVFRCECVSTARELEVAWPGVAVHIDPPIASDSVDYDDCPEAPRRRHGVKTFTKRMLRKLLL